MLSLSLHCKMKQKEKDTDSFCSSCDSQTQFMLKPLKVSPLIARRKKKKNCLIDLFFHPHGGFKYYLIFLILKHSNYREFIHLHILFLTKIKPTPNICRLLCRKNVLHRLEHKSYEECNVPSGEGVLRRDLITLYSSLKRGCGEVGVHLFSVTVIE